jgi:NAD(P)-dependent dehydrogenase (short-subunit alcohol dehydrogenase family)
MVALQNKNVVVVGGSRGLGRVIVEMMRAEGARVLAVGRDRASLDRLAAGAPGVETLALDATREDAPERVFENLRPDLLVISAGAMPPGAPLQEQTWSQFSVNWESDVRASFLFCRAALRLPLAPGATIILISSGAALGGSPISGGYAGAKRMQMFMANYCQKESDRLHLGLRFIALAPARIMSETELGAVAVENYSRYLGLPASDFIKRMSSPQTPVDVAKAIIDFAAGRNSADGSIFMVSGNGVQAAP